MERSPCCFRNHDHSCHLWSFTGFFSFVFMSRNGLGFDIWFKKYIYIWGQEKIMRVPYGSNKEFFKYSLFLVFCNRITTSAVSAAALVVSPIRSVLELECNVWTMGWFGILFLRQVKKLWILLLLFTSTVSYQYPTYWPQLASMRYVLSFSLPLLWSMFLLELVFWLSNSRFVLD